MPTVDPLAIPPAALEQGGTEVLRAFVVDGALHLSLRRAFDDPQAWGMLAADVTRHVARIYAAEKDLDEAAVIERIRDLYDAELDTPASAATTGPITAGRGP
jgi:hypothetical protein